MPHTQGLSGNPWLVSLWPQLSLTRGTSGSDSHTGLLPKAVHLEERVHSLELTTCPPCSDNGGCLCQPTLMSSKWCLGLLAWLVLGLQCPSDTRFFFLPSPVQLAPPLVFLPFFIIISVTTAFLVLFSSWSSAFCLLLTFQSAMTGTSVLS